MSEVGDGRDTGSSGSAIARHMRTRMADGAGLSGSDSGSIAPQQTIPFPAQTEMSAPERTYIPGPPQTSIPLPELTEEIESLTPPALAAVKAATPMSSDEASQKSIEDLQNKLENDKHNSRIKDFSAGPKLHYSAYLSSAFINILVLALPLVILQVYDRILPNQSKDTLAFLIFGLIGVIIVDTVMKIARSYLVGWAAVQNDYKVRCEAVKRVIYAPKSYIANTVPSVILDRINALDVLRDFYGGSSRLLILDLPFVLIFLSLIWYVGGGLVLIPIALFLVLAGATIISGRALRTVIERRLEHDDRRYDFIIEILEGIATVKLMAMEPQIQRRFERLQLGGARANYSTILNSNISQTFGSMFANISMVFVVSFGAVMVIAGDLTMGALACCTLLSGRTIQPLLKAINLWSQMQTISISRRQVRDLFDLPPADDTDIAPLGRCDGEISLRQVSFGYDAGSALLLNNINLEIPSGGVIGLTGQDGDGKSTLLKLISGELDPVHGEVLIDGVSPTGPSRRALSQVIAYVPPKSSIFQGTIMENITMFRTGDAIDHARIAAQLIGLEEDIHQLPEGYDMLLGKSITSELPDGMLQRIVIARALARAPKILLFDEANSGLDARSDKKLYQGLTQLKDHMTIILASNRPSLLKLASTVYEVSNGQLSVRPAYQEDATPAPATSAPDFQPSQVAEG